jgi:poly(A) polymerase
VSDRIRFHGHEGEGAKMAREIAGRLKLGNELTDAIERLVADHLRVNHVREMKLSTLKRFLRRDDIGDLLKLIKADCIGSHGDLELHDFAVAKLAELAAADAQAGLRPEPLADGADLITWGYLPGPAFKEILTAIEDEQLEGRLTDKEAAKEFVEARFKKYNR